MYPPIVLAIALLAPVAIASPLRVAPARELAPGKSVALKPGPRCTIHVAGLFGENETTQSCTSPLERRPRVSMVWIEDAGSISFPVRTDMAREGTLLLPLLEAVTVEVRGSSADTKSISVIRLPDGNGGSFRRQVDGRSAATFSVPRGQVIAYESDHRARVIAVSAPVKITTATTSIQLAGPKRASEVVAMIAWPDSGPDDPTGLRLVLNDGEPVPPAFSFTDAAGGFAVWYAQTRDRALLSGEGNEITLPPLEVAMRSTTVSTIRTSFRRRPTLKVDVQIAKDAIERFLAAEPSVRVTGVSNNRVVAEAVMTSGPSLLLEKLPRDSLTVELRVGKVRYRQSVTLIDLDEANVTFPISPIRIEGTVRIGDRRVRAVVGFRTGIGDLSSIESDDRGEYSIVLWNPDRYALEVRPLGEAVSIPYTKMVLLHASRRLDVDIPQGTLTVRVLDSATRKPIPAARAFGMIGWNDPEQGGWRRRSFSTKADASGTCIVDLLETGDVEVRATADGYRESAPLRAQVVDGGAGQTLEIALERVEAAARVQLVLPTGAPAAGAELLAATDPAAAHFVWQGRANANGEVDLPRLDDGAFVFIRHPFAGASLRRWSAGVDRNAWSLPPRAGSRLAVHIARRDGGPVTTAFVAVTIDGHWISGTALEFLTRTPSVVDRSGMWIADGLPAAQARLLAWRARAATEMLSGAFDALATPVPLPWPPSLTVQLVD